MNSSVHINLISAFIIPGIILGVIFSFFFIFKPSVNRESNRFQGLMLLSLSLIMFEQVLSLTGYIVYLLPLTFSSATFNFLIGPFLYLFVKRRLSFPGSRKELIHFIFPLLYFIYLIFSLVQPNEYKYNVYISIFHPDWPFLDVISTIPSDPLKINKYLNLVTSLQALFYISISFFRLVKSASERGVSIFRIKDEVLISVRNIIFQILAIIVVFIIVKTIYHGNVGDYIIIMYITLFIYITTFRIINDSAYFDRTTSFLEISSGKYRKSTLTESRKTEILEGIISELDNKKYYLNNLASLSDLAKNIAESPHNVSQVINEKLNQNFFELLAFYRVEEAKSILSGDKKNLLTVEEISEMVGYNSKTAFNNAFKKLSGKTPSEYRKQ